MNKKVLILKGMLFGIIGAIAGSLPNTMLKFFLLLSRVGEFCFRNQYPNSRSDFAITPCGFAFVPIPFVKLFLSPVLLIGGALFGLLFMFWGYRIAQKKGKIIKPGGWKGNFWWGFLGGILFDLVFLFPVIPAQ